MRDIRTFQNCHNRRHTDAIIRAQCCTLCTHPVTVNEHLDALLIEIKNGIIVLLVNHVKMGLQYDGLAVFHTGSCRFTDDDIADIIFKSFETEPGTEILYKLDDPFFFFRGTGDGVEVREILPDGLGLEMTDIGGHIKILFTNLIFSLE